MGSGLPSPRRMRRTLYCEGVRPYSRNSRAKRMPKRSLVRAMLRIASCSGESNGRRFFSSRCNRPPAMSDPPAELIVTPISLHFNKLRVKGCGPSRGDAIGPPSGRPPACTARLPPHRAGRRRPGDGDGSSSTATWPSPVEPATRSYSDGILPGGQGHRPTPSCPGREMIRPTLYHFGLP